MRGGGASKSKAGRGQPDLPVSRLLLRMGRPVTPPTDWWRTSISDGDCTHIVASSEPAKDTTTSQAAARTPANVNSHSKRRRFSSPKGEPGHLKSARSGSRGPGDTYSFPADLSDATASRRTPSASPTSTKRGGAAAMGPHMGSAVEDIPQCRSTCVPMLPASMEGTSKGHHRHPGPPLADPTAMPANVEPLATCPTQPRDSGTSAQGQLSNTAHPTPDKGVSREAWDGDHSQGGAGEQPPAECPAARVLRTGRVSQVPTPWWVGSAVPSSAAACSALPLRSPSCRQGTRSSRSASTAREGSQHHSGPSPADILTGQTGKASTRQALFRATPGKERPTSSRHPASPPQKRRRLLRQPIANIVRRVECGLPPAQLPPPMEAALGDGALLLEAASPSPRGQAGIQELPQQLVTCSPDACQTETPLMLVSTAHAVSSPSHALPADASGGPATGPCQRSASRACASLSREPQLKGPPCLRPQPSWQSGVSGGTSSACLHPVSPQAGQGMRRASASRSSLDRMPTQDSVGVDVEPSLSGSIQSGEHVSDKRPCPPDRHHVPPEGGRASPLLDTSAVPGDGEGGLEQHMEARRRDPAANEELTGASPGLVPEQRVIARGGSGLPQGQANGGEEEMGIVLASASPRTIASHQASHQAQPEDSALQVERTASPPTLRHSVTSTTSAGAPAASGSTTLCRNCNPPSSFLPCVSCVTEAGLPGGRSARRCPAPGPAADSDLCDVTARSVSPACPSEALAASQDKLGLERELKAQPGGKRWVSALCAGALDDTPRLTGPAGNLRTRKKVGYPLRSASVLQCRTSSSACVASDSAPADVWPGGCAPGAPVSSNVPDVDPLPSAPTPSPAGNPMVLSKVASPGSPDLQYRSSANTNQANALSGLLSAAQRLRNLNRFSGSVPGDEGDRDDPSTSSVSIGGTPVRDLQPCATSGEPSRVDREPLERLDSVDALAAQLTPSAFQFLQEKLAEVEALQFCNTQA